jgi:hypothetical protein
MGFQLCTSTKTHLACFVTVCTLTSCRASDGVTENLAERFVDMFFPSDENQVSVNSLDMWTRMHASCDGRLIPGENDGQQEFHPGHRLHASMTPAEGGAFWMYGGETEDEKLLGALWKFDTAQKEWTFVNGMTEFNANPLYGEVGTADPEAHPGARTNHMSWKTSDGKLWLFGGYTMHGRCKVLTNELWAFDPATEIWTFHSGGRDGDTPRRVRDGVRGDAGVFHPDYYPPMGRDGVMAQAGELVLLYGQYGYGPDGLGYQDEVWALDTTSGNWAFMGSSGRVDAMPRAMASGRRNPATPGGRVGLTGWIADNALWIFGGRLAGDAAVRNDVWRFDLQTLKWEEVQVSGVLPSARMFATTWKSASGIPVLWSGWGRTQDNASGWMTDMWQFDTANRMWSCTLCDPGITMDSPSIDVGPGLSWPGARARAASASNGTVMFSFGGEGFDTNQTDGPLCDGWSWNIRN